jgi:hypothetical protein
MLCTPSPAVSGENSWRCVGLHHQPINVPTVGAQAFLMDYLQGERAITHRAGPVRIGVGLAPTKNPRGYHLAVDRLPQIGQLIDHTSWGNQAIYINTYIPLTHSLKR